MAVEVATTRRRFTRAEYYRMAEAGILGEDDRVELIEGEIIQMSPIGDRHVAFVINLTNLLAVRLAGHALVSAQNPVTLTDDTEPSPTSPWFAAAASRSASRTRRTCSW